MRQYSKYGVFFLFTSAVSEFSVSSILLHTAGLNKKGVFFLFSFYIFMLWFISVLSIFYWFNYTPGLVYDTID